MHLLWDFCRGEGILQSFTLPASPQQNGVAERRIGLVMEYAAHQLNLWPRVSLPETSPTLRWTGKVGDASVFRVRGSRAFVRDTSADKLSSRAIPCVFLGFPRDAPDWQFYHPTSRRVLLSQDVTFDESFPFYRVSRVDPLPGTMPVEVAVDSGAARGAAYGGAPSGGAEPTSAESGGAEPGGAEPGGTEPEGAEPGGAESKGAESGGAETRGTAPAGGLAGVSPRPSPRWEPLSPQQLREWFAQRTRLRSGAAGAGGSTGEGIGPGGAGATSPRGARTGAGGTGAGSAGAGGTGAGGARASTHGGAGATAGARGTGGAGSAGPGGAHTMGTRAAGASGVGGTGAGDPGAGGAGEGGNGAGDTGAGGTRAGGAGAEGTGAGDPGVGGAGAGGARAGGIGAGGTVQRRPLFVPPQPSSLPPPDSVLRQVLSLASSSGLPPSLLSPPPHQSQTQLQPDSPLPGPSPDAEQNDSFTECRELESRPASPVRAVCTCHRVPRPRPPPVPGSHIMALRPSSVPLRVPLQSPPASSLPTVPGPESDLARAARPTVPRLLAIVVTDPSFESTAASALVAELEDFECLAAAVPHLVDMLLASEGDPDAPDILTPRSYVEAITGPYSSQWQTAMDAEMASWKSTGTYVDAVPLSGANIVDCMWIFRVKRPPGSPPVFKARYAARGFCQRQGVEFFHTFSPTPKMTTLRVLLHVAAQRDYELHSLNFSTPFLQGSLHKEIWLCRPPGFTGSFPAGTQWSLRRPAYGIRQAPREWHDTLRTTLAALGFAPSTADPSLFLRTGCCEEGIALLVQYIGHGARAWRTEFSGTHRTLRRFLGRRPGDSAFATGLHLQSWLCFFLVEWPRSPLVLYIDNKAMLALCHKQRLEHRPKHIALRYFLARELQQRGQLRLSYVALRANTADVFTKALGSYDRQRFCTALGLLPTVPHLLVS
ncbi:unnamed protein product [Closterium sp. NIES-53]